MNKIHKILVIVLTLSCFSACENFMDIHQEWIKDGEIIYAPRIDSLIFIAGRERLEFRHWLYKSPNVRSVDLYWNDGDDSLKFPVTPSAGLDSVFVIVPNLPERSYTFTVRTTDMYGHKSLFMTGFGTTYGANYENSLNDRNIANSGIRLEDEPIGWATLLSAGTGLVRTEFRYEKEDGSEGIAILKANDNSVEMPGAKYSSYFETRSLYIPESESVDTFATIWRQHSVAFPDPPPPPPPFGPYDRSKWEVLEVSDQTESDGGGMHTLLDGNHDNYWHSQWHAGDAPCPHWAIIDMKETKNVGKFIVYRRLKNPDTKTVEFYLSDSPDPNGSWTKVGEGMFPDAGDDPIEIFADDMVTKGRYLKMNLPDTYRDPFTSVSEVYVYPPLNRYDRSKWEVLEVSDQTESDGGGMHTLLDGDLGNYWHSQWHAGNAPCPHWAIIDMKESLGIGKVEVYRRAGNTDTKTVEIFLSDSRDPDGSWTKIGEGVFPDTVKDVIEFITNDAVTGRYLKLNLPDTYRDPFISIAEIYPWGFFPDK